MLKKTTDKFINQKNKSKEFYYCKKCVINNHRPITSLENKHRNGSNKLTTRFINMICDALQKIERTNL